MRSFKRICVALIVFTATSLWSQVDSSTSQSSSAQSGTTAAAQDADDRMQTPPPVSGQSYPSAPASQERSNYVRAGVVFTTAYSDNAVGATENGHPVSDISYSVMPTIGLDETTARLHFLLDYAPGFTFYQKESSRNEADQNASIDLQYRLSPHVTFSARDGFQKSSNVFNQPDPVTAGAVSGSTEGANFSVIPPIADRVANSGNAGLSYQFSLHSMIGASGTFTNLHYPNPEEVPGLYDSSTQAGSAFYSYRISRMHYIGASYQYQRLMAYPTEGVSKTQTHAVLAFYTLYATSRLSFSVFGGPQYSDTIQPPQPPLNIPLPEAKAWTPAAGGSLSWQGRLNTFAVSYSHMISGGGGLSGAVHLDSATGSISQRLTKSLNGSVSGGYAQNDLVGALVPGSENGHSISGTVSLQQQLGQHLSAQAGYTRLHQSYGDVAVISTAPNTNREFISLSYQFARPLGR